MPYNSPLKVAEQFRMLEALYPGRIDLGIGRAPGGDRTTALAMGGGSYSGAENFSDQVQHLVAYLDDALPADHPFAKVKAMPAGPTAPEVWLLGSSDYSGALAAQLGLRFAFAHFISEAEKARIAHNRRRLVLGAPNTVKLRLMALGERFAADELMVITITGDYRTRLESYQLLSETFELCQPA